MFAVYFSLRGLKHFHGVFGMNETLGELQGLINQGATDVHCVEVSETEVCECGGSGILREREGSTYCDCESGQFQYYLAEKRLNVVREMMKQDHAVLSVTFAPIGVSSLWAMGKK